MHTCRQPPLSQLPLRSPQVWRVLPVSSSVWQRGAQQLLETTHLNKAEISFVTPLRAHTCRLYDALAVHQAVSMCECVNRAGMHEGLYLRLRGVVRVVGIVVFTRQGGLYAGGVEEAAELLLLALSQAVDDATWLLLLLQGHTDICGQCVMLYCGLYMCFLELPLHGNKFIFVWFLWRDLPPGCVSGISWATCVWSAWQPLLQWCTPTVPWPTAPPAGETF